MAPIVVVKPYGHAVQQEWGIAFFVGAHADDPQACTWIIFWLLRNPPRLLFNKSGVHLCIHVPFLALQTPVGKPELPWRIDWDNADARPPKHALSMVAITDLSHGLMLRTFVGSQPCSLSRSIAVGKTITNKASIHWIWNPCLSATLAWY